MDSFFASVEIALNPELKNVPLVVGGLSNRGVVTSCTYDVRALGVRAGMPISRARALAPHATYLQGRHGHYSDYSRRVMDVLRSFTPAVEVASIDEAYLDVTGARLRFGTPTQIAEKIRTQIREELGVPASVGIAATKTVAKIASAHAKPDGVLMIPAHATREFMYSLPIRALPGIGGKTASALEIRGITTLEQLATWDEQDLAKIVGVAGALSLQARATGEDHRQVGALEGEKSISTEETFPSNVLKPEQISAYLNQAAYQCAARLRHKRLRAWTVQIKLRDASFHTLTRSRTLLSPTDLGREIAASAQQLFAAVAFPRGGVRLAGVGVQGLVSLDGGVPVPLAEDPRPREMEKAADQVQNRFGSNAVRPASSLGRPWED